MVYVWYLSNLVLLVIELQDEFLDSDCTMMQVKSCVTGIEEAAPNSPSLGDR